MADELFDGVALAIATQSGGFGSIDTNCRDLSGALVEGDGIILGDKESGDGETGITLPNMSTIVREVSQVASSFTQQADSFIREVVEGLEITFPLKGNGATSTVTPVAGEAIPATGIDELLGTAGLAGENGTAEPDYKYKPRATTEYSTVHLWVADLDFIFQDCLVDTLKLSFTPGGIALVTASIKVGSVQSYNDSITFPTFTWGTQSTLAAPTVENVGFSSLGGSRGFESLEITVANSIEEFGDSNVATTGMRQSQKDRVITVDGRIYLTSSASAIEHTQLVSTTAQTLDMFLQLGTAESGAGGEVMNAALIGINNIQPKSIKYDRTGAAAVVEMTGSKATSGAAGDEFYIQYN